MIQVKHVYPPSLDAFGVDAYHTTQDIAVNQKSLQKVQSRRGGPDQLPTTCMTKTEKKNLRLLLPPQFQQTSSRDNKRSFILPTSHDRSKQTVPGVTAVKGVSTTSNPTPISVSKSNSSRHTCCHFPLMCYCTHKLCKIYFPSMQTFSALHMHALQRLLW